MKTYHKNKYKIIGIVAAALLLTASAAFYYRHIQIEKEKADEAKLDIERKETSKKIREGGRLLAEQQRLNPIVIQKDPLEPEERTDADELAQIKLWHQTPPKERHKLQTN